jgi:hypothetical protein
VPRIIPLVGLVGAPLLLASDIAVLFGLWEQFSLPAGIATVPIALWEFSLGVYLVVKGFRPLANHRRNVRSRHPTCLPERRRLAVGRHGRAHQGPGRCSRRPIGARLFATTTRISPTDRNSDMTSTTSQAGYPVRLTGELDPNLSRWLWLVKMFLAIPHYLVLAFLWAAFGVTTVVAGFAILFTGRYPRTLFDFNVGVLRWNWRVGFYVYAALGTDRYPPFTLARTDDPAVFDVAYPENLSRGLVVVKWLLAIPHLIIVGLIVADILPYPWTSNDRSSGLQPVGGYSVLNLLVVVAGFFLLITRQYPRGLFDLLVGINRWLYRVLTYVAFMHDEYPPFALNQGQYEPDDAEPDRPATTPGFVRPPA